MLLADLERYLGAAGFADLEVQVEKQIDQRRITAAHLKRWFGDGELSSRRSTYGQQLLEAGLRDEDIEEVAELYERQLRGQVLDWHSQLAYVLARC